MNCLNYKTMQIEHLQERKSRARTLFDICPRTTLQIYKLHGNLLQFLPSESLDMN